MAKTIQIRGKRLHRETSKCYTFLTSTYNGKFFNIARSQISVFEYFDKPIGDGRESWIKITMTPFMFDILKPKLKLISSDEVVY